VLLNFENELLSAVEQISKGCLFVYPGLSDFLLADPVQCVIEAAKF
jgi:hypothetical protein